MAAVTVGKASLNKHAPFLHNATVPVNNYVFLGHVVAVNK